MPDLVFVKKSVLMLFTDKAASAKRELSTEGARNEHFNASKVAEGKPTLVHSNTVSPSNATTWYVADPRAQTSLTVCVI